MTEPRSASDADADADGDGERASRASSLCVTVEAPPVEASAYLATWWVALADEQRVHDSHLLGEPNRTLIREAMARHIVTGGLLVARVPRPESEDAGDTDGTTDENWSLEFGSDDADDTIDAVDPSPKLETDTGGPNPATEKRVGLDGRGESATGAHTAADRLDRAGDEGAVVGFVMFGPETGSYEQSVDRGIIENLYVQPEYRNRGVGTALLDAAERALAESGVDRIALEAMADNEAARRLYARRGYSVHRVELEAPTERLESVGRSDECPGTDDTGDDVSTGRALRGDRKR